MKLSAALFALPVLLASSAFSQFKTEPLAGEGIWVDPRLEKIADGPQFRVTVWFEQQLLGDGEAFLRRAKEVDSIGRTKLREQSIAALKSASEEAQKAARAELEKLEAVSNVEFHWIVNGFSCVTKKAGIDGLKSVPGVRKIFFAGPARRFAGQPNLQSRPPAKTEAEAFDQEATEPLWYIEKLKVDRVWKELGITGKGTLNVVHDGNFIFSPWIIGTVFHNPDDPRDGEDNDGNGLVDDVNGFDFSRNTWDLTRMPLPKGRVNAGILHGHQCVGIICGRAGENRPVQPGIAPDSNWAGVVAMQKIESAVQWAVEHGADTYSMSFSRPNLADYRSHWRKMLEHGAFCGVHFVSGAGNFAQTQPIPLQMRVPEDIPHAVFAAAGVQRDLSRTPFSSQGPVEWKTDHYNDGEVEKPEVCAFNFQVPLLPPNGGKPKAGANGNSFAGPMFCGTIALMLSANPELKPWETREIIIETATDIAEEGFDFQTGHGLINAFEAVKRAKELAKKE
ncbi:MAG: S8/S53 family peptidase [Verrucomicrobiales bacterium]|nr:S8/S53 family peptidase [Verrucomicrobiales bacterium]